jgi:predicted glycogen debranching enzyme
MAQLDPGETFVLTATIEANPTPAKKAWAARMKRREALLKSAGAGDSFARQLALASDQFVIEGGANSPRACAPSRSTIIAGYHWFSDWGRDTMIALPGLCVETRRLDVARDILWSFGRYVSKGMLPNRCPDRGEEPEYNTVDATLWYFEAIRHVVKASGNDAEFVRLLWPTLTDIIAWHVRGTRFGIGVDAEDGLLQAGAPGVQLTWMDARIGDWVVTPRAGKPVEINALWINALRTMESLARVLGEPSAEYATFAENASESFRRKFVRADGLGLYDLVAEEGADASIRPNQILAVSLEHCALSPQDQAAVVNTVQSHLLTPFGLRTLSPQDPAYRPHYRGAMADRDSAYHQGTVWPWLLGAFVEAHLKVHGKPAEARAFLEPLHAHLLDAGVGSISEVFDAEQPFHPDGCIAQAWSVAEILRAWNLVNKWANRPESSMGDAA